ncbi:MAG: transglycosylase domain-containing protein [Ktedonobacteraceae bacterium]|nr:transglycosylase domain-containing protein [Ktedonobacteraceae bacterium]
MSTDQNKPEEGRDLSTEHIQKNTSSPTEDLHPVMPASRPRPGNIITSRQEKALRYMERKRTRQERISQQVVKASVPEEVIVAPFHEEIQKNPITSLELIPASTVETVQSRRKRRHRKIILRHLSRKYMRLTRKQKQHEFNRLWITISSTSLAFLVIFLSLTGAGAFAAYRFYNQTQQKYTGDVLTLRDLMPKDNLKMYDSKNTIIAQLTAEGIHTTIKYPDIAKNLINATVATEDKNFWDNPGIDLTRIIQAAIDDLRSGHVVSGGSTITQQLIKNLIVGDETSITRKLQEIILVPELNNRYSKTDIIEMYLNSIYYGEQAYGVDAAAGVYFGLEDRPGKPASKQLDIAQAAMLAGIPASPSSYDPLKHPQAAFNRFENVLTFMQRNGYINRLEVINAIDEAQQPHFFKKAATLVNRAPHFAELVYSQLEKTFHVTRLQLERSDMIVHTTLDISLQDKIQKIAQRHIAELRSAHNLSNAAEVLIDYHTGAIRSLLGSIDYNNKSIDGQFDVATQGYRQPGSSFKPFVYVTAFQQGASPGQAISDEPTTIDMPGATPPTFTPLNYDRAYHGHLTIRCALQNSLNVPAVRTLEHVGIEQAMEMAQNMGITSYDGTPGYSLVLGGLGVHLLDETSAYGTFADGGVHVPYYAIDKIVIASTQQTYVHPKNTGNKVVSPQLAYMMTNVLSDNTSRLPEFYDCNVLQLYSNSQADCWYGNRGKVRPAAAKTGTTNDFRDNWTVGYTTDYVMGVWAGNNDNTPMVDVTGVQGAAPIWHDSMLQAEAGRPINDFVNPGGLVKATVTYPDGIKTTDWYLPGTVPKFVLPTATPAPKLTPTPTATPNGNPQAKIGAAPYCANDFSFAFTPPSPGVPSPNPGWW